jgi:hypothetical protein
MASLGIRFMRLTWRLVQGGFVFGESMLNPMPLAYTLKGVLKDLSFLLTVSQLNTGQRLRGALERLS